MFPLTRLAEVAQAVWPCWRKQNRAASIFAKMVLNLFSVGLWQDQLKIIENEYSRQEDSYKQQIADLEEEKEQLQVGTSCFATQRKLASSNPFYSKTNIPLLSTKAWLFKARLTNPGLAWLHWFIWAWILNRRNILTALRGFQDKLLYLVLFSLYPSLFWELRDKRN